MILGQIASMPQARHACRCQVLCRVLAHQALEADRAVPPPSVEHAIGQLHPQPYGPLSRLHTQTPKGIAHCRLHPHPLWSAQQQLTSALARDSGKGFSVRQKAKDARHLWPSLVSTASTIGWCQQLCTSTCSVQVGKGTEITTSQSTCLLW